MGELEEILTERALKEGMPIPDRIANAPDIFPWLMLYMRAFFALDTHRSHSQGVSRIPWLAIEQYARINEFDTQQKEDLHFFTSRLDDFMCKKLAAKMKPNPAK